MPSWTAEDGTDVFNKASCKRCLRLCALDADGEIPPHDCVGGRYRSESSVDARRYPVYVGPVLSKRARSAAKKARLYKPPKTPPPNPGSPAALLAGCRCPVLDNAHGRGYGGQPDLFVYSGECPLHAAPNP